MKKVVLALCCFLLIFGCSKDNKETPDNPETTDYLLGKWNFDNWSGNCPIGNVTSSKYYSSHSDNSVTFNADGSFVIDYGTLRGEGEPATGNNSGKWTSEEKNGVRTISITSGKFNLYWDIQSFVITELSANKLVFNWSRAGGHPKGPTIYSFKK